MKKIIKDLFLIILAFLISWGAANYFVKMVYAADTSARGKSMEMTFNGSPVSSRYGENEFWLDDFLLSNVLCIQHGSPQDYGRDGKDPTVQVTVKYFDHTKKFSYSSWEDMAAKEKELWKFSDSTKDESTDDADIELKMEVTNQPSLTGVPSPSQKTDSGDDAEAKVKSNGKTKYSSKGSESFTNNALAYVLAECANDAGLLPGSSYVNVTVWALLYNPNAAAGITSDYFSNIEAEDYAFNADAFKELIKKIDQLLADPTVSEAQKIKLRKAKVAAQQLITSLSLPATISTTPDPVNDVTAAAAKGANDLFQEATIFGAMWNELNGSPYNGDYSKTVIDNTKMICGNNLENLHVQFHSNEEWKGAPYYIIGPFNISYLEYYTSVTSSGNGGQFCGMTGTPQLTAKIDGQAATLDYGDEWEFAYGDVSEFTESNFGGSRKNFPHIPKQYNEYPHSGESFFIKVKYQEGLHEISKIKFFFRYMTASGGWTKYEGDIYVQEWESAVKTEKCTAGKNCSCGGHHTEKQYDDSEPPQEICDGAADPCDHDMYEDHYVSIKVVSSEKYTETKKDVQDFANVDRTCVRQYDTWNDWTGDQSKNPHVKEFTWNIDLTTNIKGYVWEDTDSQKDNNKKLGVWDEAQSAGVKNVDVEVFIYSRTTKAKMVDKDGKPIHAIMHKSDGTRVTNPVFKTNANGEWNHEGYMFEAPGYAKGGFFVAEFHYDGQYFQDTLFLSPGTTNDYSEDGAEGDASTAYSLEMNSLEKRSKATTGTYERREFDKSFGIITGDEAMGSDLKTTGETFTTDLKGENASSEAGVLKYEGDTSPSIPISKLDEPMKEDGTEDEKQQAFDTEGKADYYERFKLMATTYYNQYIEGLVSKGAIPNSSMTASASKYQVIYPKETTYWMDKYKKSAVFPNQKNVIDTYMENLNLGLVKRKETDLSTIKDLYKVTLVVNEQKIVYQFDPYGVNPGRFADIHANLEIIKNSSGKYSLGLYESDVGYSSKYHYSQALKRVRDLKEGTELRVFATYMVRLYNNSDIDDATINKVVDYPGNDMTLISEDMTAPIVNDMMKRETTRIAEAPFFRVCSQNDSHPWKATREELLEGFDSTSGPVTWEKPEANSTFYVTDSVRYYPDTAGDNAGKSVMIDNNQFIEIYTTYEIDREGYETVRDNPDGLSIEDAVAERMKLLNEDGHINTVEIGSYSTFYGASNGYRNHTSGDIAGRVDRDSAPNNAPYGDSSKYEDDTYESPALKFSTQTKIRKTSGKVFEDTKTVDKAVTSVELDSGAETGQAKTIKVGDGVCSDSEKGIPNVKVSLYEVINLGYLDENNFENYAGLEYYYKLPGTAFEVTTSADPDTLGEYEIDGFLAGDYVLRFDYGTMADEKATIYSQEHPGGEADVDVVKYNGQDYENTKFLGDRLNNSSEKYGLNTKFLAIDGKDDAANPLKESKVSKARDNESRRLEVMGYSRTIENERGEILRDRKADGEFIEKTMMFAETPIMKVEIEESSKLNSDSKEPENDNTTLLVDTYGGSTEQANRDKLTSSTEVVDIKNIFFGLEERARTDIELKSKIKEIMVLKSGEQIFDVKLDDEGKVDFTSDPVRSRNLTYMPTDYKTTHQQGFYALGIESSYMEGLNIMMHYRIDVINKSEIDFTSKLAGMYRQDVIDSYAKKVPTTSFYKTLYESYERDAVSNDTILDPVDVVNQGDTYVYTLSTNATKALYDYLIGDLGEGFYGYAHSDEFEINEAQPTDMIKPEVVAYGIFTGRYYYENEIYNKTTDAATYTINDYAGGYDSLGNVSIEYDRDKIVRTAVNNVVNYVDVDTEFNPAYNYINASWTPVGDGDNGTDQMNGMAYDGDYAVFKSLISKASFRQVNTDMDFFDFKDRKYITRGSSNILFSNEENMVTMDDKDAMDDKLLNSTGDSNRRQYSRTQVVEHMNPKLAARELEPVDYVNPTFMEAERNSDGEVNYYELPENDKLRTMGEINVYTDKVTTSNQDANEIHIDNLTEVLVYSNVVGRKDQYSVPGNALAIGASATKLGLDEKSVWYSGYNSIRGNGAEGYVRTPFAANDRIANSAKSDPNGVVNQVARQWTLYPEDDAWAPEYVAIFPPTGIPTRLFIKNNMPIIMAATLAVLGLGFVFIKKQIKIREDKKK